MEAWAACSHRTQPDAGVGSAPHQIPFLFGPSRGPGGLKQRVHSFRLETGTDPGARGSVRTLANSQPQRRWKVGIALMCVGIEAVYHDPRAVVGEDLDQCRE